MRQACYYCLERGEEPTMNERHIVFGLGSFLEIGPGVGEVSEPIFTLLHVLVQSLSAYCFFITTAPTEHVGLHICLPAHSSPSSCWSPLREAGSIKAMLGFSA